MEATGKAETESTGRSARQNTDRNRSKIGGKSTPDTRRWPKKRGDPTATAYGQEGDDKKIGGTSQLLLFQNY